MSEWPAELIGTAPTILKLLLLAPWEYALEKTRTSGTGLAKARFGSSRGWTSMRMSLASLRMF
jgi:hypothetical protein